MVTSGSVPKHVSSTAPHADFEKLGAFYLGRAVDPQSGAPQDGWLLYDSKDLVTHAVCVGMTGSGKTGLCLSLLEEAAIDGIPALAIDPKGDIANLLLTFPSLRGADFEPWVNAEDARKAGLTVEAHAAAQAEAWRKGLEEWGMDAARIQKLRDAADFVVYTPGSSAGLGVSVLSSFAAPSPEVRADAEALGEQVRATVSGLLGLAGLDADPLQSREHILLSTILAREWREGRSLDLAAWIGLVQAPKIEKIGVLDLESFFPKAERFSLALRLNNLVASPAFAAWTAGAPLDVGAFLHTPTGKPRISIFSIAHLSDAERMFFVATLLNRVVGWMRGQSGTTSLRAVVYMDEIFGYLPPVANPPSKQPFLTLLKQARAYGIGMLLATQNPVDLDYKALGNAGTWFIGRLQTDRDKARVLDGLEGAAATAAKTFDRASLARILSGLSSRMFLLQNAHEDVPVIFRTRWSLSYLRGPLTRDQIATLMETRRETPASLPARASEAPAAAAPHEPGMEPAAVSGTAPVLPPKIPQCFLPLRSSMPAGASLVYRPGLLGTADVYFTEARSGASAQERVSRIIPLTDGPVPADWSTGEPLEVSEEDLESSAQPNATFARVPPRATDARAFDALSKGFADSVYRTARLDLLRSSTRNLLSLPRETERDFRARLAHSLREDRDRTVEKLRQRYAARVTALEEKIRRAEAAKDVQEKQASAAKVQTAISFGASILGALLGRKTLSAANIGRATTAARGVGRSIKESQDATRAGAGVEGLRGDLAELEAQLQAEIDAVDARVDASSEPLETVSLRPRKSDVRTRLVSWAWMPFWVRPEGSSPAWE